MKYFLMLLVMTIFGLFAMKIMDNTSADSHTTGSARLWYSPYIAANVNLGDSIDVCSDHYPDSTEAAVILWNTSLSAYLDHDVFKWQKTSSFCSTPANSKDRIDYVIVEYVAPGKTAEEKEEDCPNIEAHACLKEYPRNMGTFIGRMRVVVQVAHHKPAVDSRKPFTLVRDIAHEIVP